MGGHPKTRKSPQLTKRQQLFVAHVLADPEGDAKKAAIAAGYSEKRAGPTSSELMRHRDVRYAIDAKTAKRLKKLEITADSVLKNVRDIVVRCSVEGKAFNPAQALKGLELLGKFHKLWTDKIETNEPTLGHRMDKAADAMEKARKRLNEAADTAAAAAMTARLTEEMEKAQARLQGTPQPIN